MCRGWAYSCPYDRQLTQHVYMLSSIIYRGSGHQVEQVTFSFFKNQPLIRTWLAISYFEGFLIPHPTNIFLFRSRRSTSFHRPEKKEIHFFVLTGNSHVSRKHRRFERSESDSFTNAGLLYDGNCKEQTSRTDCFAEKTWNMTSAENLKYSLFQNSQICARPAWSDNPPWSDKVT